ncbi:MAG: HNH endonuclease [Lachnospiraceae bacterium]|nr:HNH endonuclease [Lachnospiraceae bacterium]
MNVTRNIYFVHDNGKAELKCGDAIILLDAENVDLASSYQWTVGTHGYVTSGAGKKQTLLHRLVAGAEDGCIVDHVNRNKLDNRKSNLRICTCQQNMFNREQQANNQSGYKGVCQTKGGLWQAQIQYCGRAVYLGCYGDALSAAAAYDAAARRLFGEYAFLNLQGVKEIVQKNIRHKFKLSQRQVEDIRFLYGQGMTINELSGMFQHSYSSIRRIVRNKTFRPASKEEPNE